jgi:glycosyltransferase involved in cell wall biosynthesis
MIDLLGVPEGKIVVSGNGVDEGYFREPEGVRTGSFMNHRPYVLLVGGLRREKGGVESLAVARLLRKTCPDLEFRVAGLPNDPNLVAIAEGLGNFHFAGKVDDAMLSGLYREARCLLFLSLYEGFGMPPLEAMACRTPVICANRASLPEVVGEAARLVEPESADEIADWIAEIVRHPRAAGGLIAKGREQAAALTWQRVASRVKEALAQHQWPTPPMGKRCP